jgi:hypothetical protein
MKKNLLIVVIVVLALLAGGFWYLRGRGGGGSATSTPTPEGKLIETPLEERPYVTLTPSQDGHWLTLNIERIVHGGSLEYELIYNTASGVPQGSTNAVDLKGETSYTQKILLGTESRGHYRYDEGVTEGTLTLRFRNGEGVRKFVTEFHLQQGEDELTSIDKNFSLSGNLSASDFYLTIPTVGLPGKIEGRLMSGPYGVFTSGKEAIKNGEVSLTLAEEAEKVELLSWTGTDWQEEDEGLNVKGKIVSAETGNLTTFIAVASE